MDNQNEDVFFHVSKARLPQPITVGQKVYFNSERNDKNQLRATEVTPFLLNIQESPDDTELPKSASTTTTNNHHQSKKTYNRQNRKSLRSTLFSVLALIAAAVYFFGDIPSGVLSNGVDSTEISSTYSESEQSNTTSITGDAQIDTTIQLIQQGGPFPYPNKDGTTFYNREGRLPSQSQGYYREYTVPTPGVSHRGARRIVTGGNPPTIYYLTVDHYDSFKKLDVK